MLFKDRFRILSLLFSLLIILSAVIRTVLLLTVWKSSDPGVWMLVKEYAVGFFYDTITFSYAAVPFALYLALVPERFFAARCNRVAVHAATFLVIYLLLFDGVAEYFFFSEFGTRFNFIAIDYLVYTREVLGNIRESYRLNLILLALFVASAAVHLLLRCRIDRALGSPAGHAAVRLRTGLAFTVMPLLAFTFVDLSFTNISANQYANEIAGNGIYDLFAAFRNNELDYDRFYPTRDAGEVMTRLRDLTAEPAARFAGGDARDIRRTVAGRGAEKRLNVIVVVEESLSAEYLGAYGDTRGLTPNLDRLSRDSLLFTRMFATGTRTVRGLEAITLSLPPLPGIAIVKRPDNGGFRSWGTIMREKGYDTRYIYAGYGYFDNMSAFYSGNGFTVVDRSSFAADEVTFSNIWGVCDEDLFRKTISEARASHKGGNPFFSIVMTTSNHRPYTYPDGKIDIPSKTGRGGGVKYADYAIGRFLEEARKEPWYRDTVFVFIADHCAASSGSTEVPVAHYRIPLLVHAPAHVRPGRVDILGSQIDLAPTVLGLLNMGYTSTFFGRDLLGPQNGAPQRAFLSTYQKLALLEGGSLVVLSPQKQVRGYVYDWNNGVQREGRPDEENVRDALAYFQGANYVYKHRLNRL